MEFTLTLTLTLTVRHDAMLAEGKGAVLLQVLVEVDHGVEAPPARERPRRRRRRPGRTAALEPPAGPYTARWLLASASRSQEPGEPAPREGPKRGSYAGLGGARRAVAMPS